MFPPGFLRSSPSYLFSSVNVGFSSLALKVSERGLGPGRQPVERPSSATRTEIGSANRAKPEQRRRRPWQPDITYDNIFSTSIQPLITIWVIRMRSKPIHSNDPGKDHSFEWEGKPQEERAGIRRKARRQNARFDFVSPTEIAETQFPGKCVATLRSERRLGVDVSFTEISASFPEVPGNLN